MAIPVHKHRFVFTLDKELVTKVQNELKDQGYPANALSFYVNEQIKKLAFYLDKGTDPYANMGAFHQGLLFEEELEKQKR